MTDHKTSSGYNFFKTKLFESRFMSMLGKSYHMGAGVGKVLYMARQIADGDFELAYQTLFAAGEEARAIAEDSFNGGHVESSRQSFLWALNYYHNSTYFLDGTNDASRFLPTWELVDSCWLKAIPLFDPPIEIVEIPYENTHLRGFYIRGNAKDIQRPLLILNNGSDGSVFDMWLEGGAGAVARGYDCLIFEGPGQGHALWKQKLFFRPDWENVITPIVDFVLGQLPIDPKKIALIGVSQGGYWVPRAVAFEKRIAAAIADPGVMDVATSWNGYLPPPMFELLKSGCKDEFDGYMAEMMSQGEKSVLDFRRRPYGFDSYFDVFNAVQEYNLESAVNHISCPLLITDPVNEGYWPGQSQRLFDAVAAPKSIVKFSESEGADQHCEPQALGLRDLRIFNWLDEILKTS